MKKKYFFFIILLLILKISCKSIPEKKEPILTIQDITPKKNIKPDTSKEVLSHETKVTEDLFYNFLNEAESIKIVSFTIESADLATHLYKLYLAGTNIEIILSNHSLGNIKSKINYFKQTGIDIKFADIPGALSSKCIVIIDNKLILKNINPLLYNENPYTIARPVKNEIKIWNYCEKKPSRCWAALRRRKKRDIKKTDSIKRIPTFLPTKTIKEKFLEEIKK